MIIRIGFSDLLPFFGVEIDFFSQVCEKKIDKKNFFFFHFLWLKMSYTLLKPLRKFMFSFSIIVQNGGDIVTPLKKVLSRWDNQNRLQRFATILRGKKWLFLPKNRKKKIFFFWVIFPTKNIFFPTFFLLKPLRKFMFYFSIIVRNDGDTDPQFLKKKSKISAQKYLQNISK